MSEKVNAPEISVKNVSMVFSDSKGNPVQALKNVSIDIQKGESYRFSALQAAVSPHFFV